MYRGFFLFSTSLLLYSVCLLVILLFFLLSHSRWLFSHAPVLIQFDGYFFLLHSLLLFLCVTWVRFSLFGKIFFLYIYILHYYFLYILFWCSVWLDQSIFHFTLTFFNTLVYVHVFSNFLFAIIFSGVFMLIFVVIFLFNSLMVNTQQDFLVQFIQYYIFFLWWSAVIFDSIFLLYIS